MGDEKWMTADELQELGRMYGEGRSRHATVEMLLHELSATRADLAELVAASPECGNADHDCTAKATYIGGPSSDYFACDAHVDRWVPAGGWQELPIAPLLRRLAERSKR